MKIIELFGGIGACSKALEKLNIEYEIVDYVEIDKYAVASFNAMHGTNFEPQDICKWDKDLDADLIMHGSPCQDFSIAGKQAGGDKNSGTRSSLMYETIRIVEKVKPKYVIWENVKNIISKKHRHNFDSYLEAMEELGYKNYYQVLNAKDYGIPQNRERVFTISIRDNDLIVRGSLQEHASIRNDGICPTLTSAMGMGGGQVPIIYKKSADFTFPPKQELKIKLKDLLEDKVDEKYYLSEKLIKYYNKKIEQGWRKELTINPEVSSTICNPSRNQVNDTFIKPKVVGGVGKIGSTGQYHLQNRIYDNKIGVSVTTSFNPNYIDNNLRIRKLTPKECWRLMGFDDEDFEKASKVCSNTQLYKQAGNSIVVNVLMAILNNLLLESKQNIIKGQTTIFDFIRS